MRGESVVREFLVSEGIPVARYRRKQLFTPYLQRIRILEENSEKPIEWRTHSLRRKLTPLDRALSDNEAYALDRAFSAWLALNGKSKSVDFSFVGGGGSNDKLPLNDRELKEAKAYQIAIGLIGVQNRLRLMRLFERLAPWGESSQAPKMEEVKLLAKAIFRAYAEQK